MSDQVADKKTGAEDVAWDLTHLYAGTDDPQIERDMDRAEEMADKLAAEYRTRIADLDAEEMRDMLEQYEDVLALAHEIGAYAYLNWSTNTEDPARGALLQKTRERGSQLEQKLVFIDLEWANAPDEKAQAFMDDPVLADFRHWMEVSRLRKPYLLSEPEEKILSEKNVTGHDAWYRFFDETHAAARYPWEGDEVPMQMVLTKLFEQDRKTRKKAQEVVTEGLNEMSRTMTYIFNTILADKASTDRLRGYPTWISSRNLANEVDDESVEALIDAVTARYDIVERYYNLKAKLLGFDELYDYDRYAPLPAADKEYLWDAGKSLVLESFAGFDQRMADIAGKFFDEHWIDAPVREGKGGGAYAMPMTPNTHPYVMLNYEAKPRDVMTLAHELGHGIHQWLYREQGMLHGRTPLTTAETASVFGEMLVFQEMMRREPDDEVRLAMLTAKLEDSFATVFRQVAMNRFEHAIHTARREGGELPTEQFNELWTQTQEDMFRGSVTITENYGVWWSYVGHFVDRPGYVYAYSFGELLVLALYARYEEAPDGFADKYIEMLSKGSSDWPHEIVRPLGVDLTDPTFWENGLQILDDMVKDAEELAAKVS